MLRLELLRLVHHRGLVARVDVDGAHPVEGRLGHPEERDEELYHEGGTHGVQARPPRSVLDNRTSCDVMHVSDMQRGPRVEVHTPRGTYQ